MSVEKTKINELELKTNYLLSTQLATHQNNQQRNQFSDKEATGLRNILHLFQQLGDAGASSEEFFGQFNYLADINAFSQIKQELSSHYNSEQYGVHSNIYNFVFDGYNTINNSLSNNAKLGFISENNPLFQEGIIVIEGRHNVMVANQNNILLNSTSKTYNWTLLLDPTFPRIIITKLEDNDQIGVIGQYDVIQGIETRQAISTDFYVLHYERGKFESTLRFLFLDIDINTTTLYIKYSNCTVIENDFFDDMILNLPPRVTLTTFGFKSSKGNELTTLENLYIQTRMNQLESNLLATFQHEYTNNNINSLYGQSAAVSISQLYGSLNATVRKLKAEYLLTTPTKIYSGVERPASFPTFTVPNKNILDVIGNSCPFKWRYNTTEIILGNRVVWSTFSPFRLKIEDYPKANLVNEVGGKYVTGFSMAEWRQQIPKSVMTQYLPGGATTDIECWIETETVANGVSGNVIKGAWLKVSDDNYLDVQFEGDFNDLVVANGEEVQLEGSFVYVEDTYGVIKENISYTVLIGYKHVQQVQNEVRFVINPMNASAEGTARAQINLQLRINDENVTKSVMVEKRQIAYGSGEINAYTAVLDITQGDQLYYYGQSFQVKFYNTGEQNVYKQRTDNFPTHSGQASGYDKLNVAPSGRTRQQQYSKINNVTAATTIDLDTVLTETKQFCLKDYDQTKPLQFLVPPMYTPVDTINRTYLPLSRSKTKSAYVAFGPSRHPGQDTSLSPASIKFQIQNFQEIKQIDQYSIYPAYYVNESGKSFSMIDFTDYKVCTLRMSNLLMTQDVWLSDALEDRPTYEVITADFTLEDIFLPDAVLDQINLSESIVKLQSAVEFLQYYATYLQVLIDNLDRRVTYVEDALEQIIAALNTVAQQQKTSLGFAGGLINFLGTGIGMFFPLIGLGCSLLGGLLTSIDKIEQGDVIMGSIDLVIGGMMSVLGIYKYNKRIKNKYGQQEIPKEPVFDSKDISMPPGYTLIDNDPPPMYTPRQYKNGIFRNSSLASTILPTGSECIITSNIGRQGSLWNEIDWSEDPGYINIRKVGMYGVMIETIRTSEARTSSVEKEYKYVMARLNKDGTTQEKLLTDRELLQYLDVKASIEDYVKLEFHYSLTVTSYNTTIGMDPETYACLVIGNGYDVGQKSKQLIPYYAKNKKKKWRFNRMNTLTRNTKLNGPSVTYGPIAGSGIIFNAINPYRQLESSQATMYSNCIEECEKVFT